MKFLFITEEVVTRATVVEVADNFLQLELIANQKFWDGRYLESIDVDRRDEKILKQIKL